MRFLPLLVLPLFATAQLVPVEQLKIPENKESYASADQPQALSMSGNSLFGQKDTAGEIAKAREAVTKDASDAIALIQLGRTQDSFSRFRESIETYTDGIARFPKDWRFLRYRGQRYISTRKFDDAIKDLEAARAMTKSSYDVAYYLGLAYYFNGDFDKSAAEMERCEAQMKTPLDLNESTYGATTCESGRENLAFIPPLAFWRYLALRRAGKTAAAKAYAESISPLWKIEGSVPKAFYDTILYFRGNKEVNEMLAGQNEGTRDYLTRATGLAAYMFTEGERQRACALWQRISLDTKWDHLGVVAAEAEYFLNSKAACALYTPQQDAAPPK